MNRFIEAITHRRESMGQKLDRLRESIDREYETISNALVDSGLLGLGPHGIFIEDFHFAHPLNGAPVSCVRIDPKHLEAHFIMCIDNLSFPNRSEGTVYLNGLETAVLHDGSVAFYPGTFIGRYIRIPKKVWEVDPDVLVTTFQKAIKHPSTYISRNVDYNNNHMPQLQPILEMIESKHK